MQRTFECPICSDFFDSVTKFPKNLSCGHSFCSPCLELVRRGSDAVHCPKCRVQTRLPSGKVDLLPTNYLVLEMLESMCEDCRERPRVRRCPGHCSKSLCDGCTKDHSRKVRQAPDVNDFSTLREMVDSLSGRVADDRKLAAISSRCERVIGEMTEVHRSQVRLLEERLEQNTAEVKAVLAQDTEEHFKWKEAVGKLVWECNVFMEKSKRVGSTRAEEVAQERDDKVRSLTKIEAEEPTATEVEFLADMSGFVESCRNHNTLLKSTGDGADDMYENLTKAVEEKIYVNASDEVDVAKTTQSPAPAAPDYRTAAKSVSFSEGLAGPAGVCVDDWTGLVILTDSSNSQIVVLSDQFVVRHRFGSPGSDFGEYSQPWGVDTDGESIFVADFGNHRICITDMNGSLKKVVGSHGNGKDQFNLPSDLAVDKSGGKQLFVCDSANSRVKVLQKRSCKYIREFGQTELGDDKPSFIALSPPSGHAGYDRTVAVTTYAGHVHLFSVRGRHIRSIRNKPHDLDASGVVYDRHGHLLITDNKHGRVAVLTDAGELTGFIGRRQSLRGPWGVAVDSKDNVLVADCGNKRLQVFKTR